MSKIRVRFAPSPTGFVHVGGLRTALYNYLFAKKRGGTFILRIEDTDRSRYVEGATENLIAVLNWAGLVPDEGPEQGGDFGPYFQSQRQNIYRDYARELINGGRAYYAFDTPEEIEEMRRRAPKSEAPPKYDASLRMQMRNSLSLSPGESAELLEAGAPYVIRLLIPEDRTFTFNDIIRGQVSFHSRQIDDQVLIKSDGYPTYHLANVVDDHLMQISHVIRGEEWLSSVPKHVYLYECFGWKMPDLAHLPLIFNPDGTKMSKRNIQSLDELPSGKVDPDVQTYIDSGYEKEAILNYIAFLGWNPGDDRDVFTLRALQNIFSLERVNKSAAIFDLQKLNYLNQEHLHRMETDVLAEELKTEMQKAGIHYDADAYFKAVVDLLKSRLHFRKEFVEYSTYFFKEPESYDPQVVKKRWKGDSAKLLFEFIDEISKLDRFDAGSIEKCVRQIADRHEIGSGRIIHPVRLAVSGIGVGPGLFEMLQILGREKVTKRVKNAIEMIPARQQ
ncbi:glutamate--tRNA ligase [candidate division KSB1 bacterium]|nr:glutamate--tRNA ligase [candidate division KSB1 bacterium]RQW00653.1 MAG: glutamate--tRNA ligase [candidate division KSB1 bacterium]